MLAVNLPYDGILVSYPGLCIAVPLAPPDFYYTAFRIHCHSDIQTAVLHVYLANNYRPYLL